MPKKRRVSFLLPLTTCIMIFLLLKQGLHLDTRKIPSPLIDKPVPEFNLPDLHNPQKMLNNRIFLGKVSLLNVFASWCSSCALEHPVLVDIAQSHVLPIYGLDYKDQRQEALRVLHQLGNPYAAVGFDQDGSVAIDWGVYGTPETFIIDKQGHIRYKYIGIISSHIWKSELLPIVQKLKKES